MDENSDKPLREHVLYVLRGEGAHITFDDFVADFPVERCGERVAGCLTPHGKSLNISASRSGTFWNSAVTQNTFHLSGQKVTGRGRNRSEHRSCGVKRLRSFAMT